MGLPPRDLEHLWGLCSGRDRSSNVGECFWLGHADAECSLHHLPYPGHLLVYPEHLRPLRDPRIEPDQRETGDQPEECLCRWDLCDPPLHPLLCTLPWDCGDCGPRLRSGLVGYPRLILKHCGWFSDAGRFDLSRPSALSAPPSPGGLDEQFSPFCRLQSPRDNRMAF